MRTADLSAGMEVLVRLPYDGGIGWAEVLDPRAEPRPAHARAVWVERARTVRIRFLPGEAVGRFIRELLVRPADIVRGREDAPG